ncbi:MAG: transglycosylase SLT domain-containing protein [Pseudomonadota bacterium]
MDMALRTAIEHCAPAMNRALMAALVRRESDGNRFAIGMDGNGVPVAQPTNLIDAVAAAEGLARIGKGFSVGLAQIHISNIRSMGLSWEQAFDACTSLRKGQQIFEHFHVRAIAAGFKNGEATFAALRGYNSGNVFAPISNNYASAIMADAVNGAMPALRARSPATASRTITSSEQENRSEAIELFGK